MRSKQKKTTAFLDEKIPKKTKSKVSSNSNIASESKNRNTISSPSRNLGVKRKKEESTNTINISDYSNRNKAFSSSEKTTLNKDTELTDTRRPKRKKRHIH